MSIPIIADKRAEARCRYYVREEANRLGWDVRHPSKGGLFLEEQEITDYFPTLKKYLGHERPDFAGLAKDHQLRMVIECKNDVKLLDQAWNEACAYANNINKDSAFEVRLAIGVAGTPDYFVQTRGYFLKSRNKWVPLESYGYPLTQLPTLDELDVAIDKSDGTTDVQLPDEREFFDASVNLNRILRLIKIPETMRPKVIGAIIVALYKGEFSYANDVVLDHINSNVKAAITSFDGIDSKRKLQLIDTLKLHAEGEAIKNSIHEIIYQLERLNVRSIMRSGVDFLGKFYEAFLRYGSTEGKGMGIVFTPRHITKYCAELTDVRLGMKVYDPSAGTGGFLVAAFDKMMQEATTPAAKRKVKESLYGCDTDPTVWALSVLNMFFRGDGKSHIEFKSCFVDADKYEGAFERVLLNPPFSQEGEPEINFIDHALNSLKPNGELAVVVKTNVLVDPDLAYWRKNLVTNHHVLAVISLPEELFYPTAAPTVILLVRAHTPDKNLGTFLAKIQNDGFIISKKRRIPAKGSQLEAIKELYNNYRQTGKAKLIPNMATVIERKWIESGEEICAEQWLPSGHFGIEEFESRRQESIQQMTLSIANYPDITDELIDGFENLLMDGPKRTRPVKRTSLDEWFFIDGGHSVGSKNYPGGNIPYISSGDDNNSIVTFIQPPVSEIFDSPCITITGFGKAYIQPWRFCARGNGGSAVRVLRPKFGMTLSELTWFAGQINDQRWRFNYGRMATIGRIKKLRVHPPIFELPIISSLENRLIEFKNRLTELWKIQSSTPTLEEKFRNLVIRWKVERDPISTAIKMAEHLAYKEIISMGSDVVPLILNELAKEPDYWFIALNVLTGENPVPNSKRGNVKEMANSWIEWGVKKGIITEA